MSKYLVLTPFFPSETSFQGSFVYDQCAAIKKITKNEVSIVLITSAWNKLKDYQYKIFFVNVFKNWDFPSFILPGILHFLNTIRLKHFIRTHIKNYRHIGIIHAHAFYPCGKLAISLKKKVGHTVIMQHHGLDVLQKNNGKLLRGWFRVIHNRYIERLAVSVINKVDLNVGVSRKVIKQILKIEKCKNASVAVCYNGVDKNKFFKMSKMLTLEYFHIGCIGNFWEIKDQITLIKAVEYLINNGLDKKIMVSLMGNGPTKKVCQKYIADNNLHAYFSFRENMAHDDLNKFYNSLHLFVLPSYYEAFGCVYVEAYSCGVPFIAVKGQGIGEILAAESRRDYLIEPHNPIDLGDKIKMCMDERAVHQRCRIDIDIIKCVGSLFKEISKSAITNQLY